MEDTRDNDVDNKQAQRNYYNPKILWLMILVSCAAWGLIIYSIWSVL